MAQYDAIYNSTSTITAATTTTVLQVAASATQRLKVKKWGLSFNGSSATVPVRVELLRQTTGGTMTAFTPLLRDPADGVASAAASYLATVEPTAGDVMESFYIPANNGMYEWADALSDEIVVGLSGRIGIRATPPTGVTVAPAAFIVFEEKTSCYFRFAAITTTAAATKSIIQIAAASTNRVRLTEFGIGFDAVSPSAPVRMELLRQTTAGTFTNATNAPLLNDPADGSAATNIQTDASAEPTAGDILEAYDIAANNGMWVKQYPKDEGPMVALSGRLALRVVAPAGVSPAASGYVKFDES